MIFPVMCMYISCVDLFTCIHETDAELTCICFSQAF